MDVVETDRIAHSLQRFGRRFVQKICTPEEVQTLVRRGLLAAESAEESALAANPAAGLHPAADAPPSAQLTSAVAARFAAKEAAVKALGTGFAHGIGMHDIEIFSLPTGQPEVRFSGPAAQRMAQLGAARAHISLTHSRDTAAAVVILEA